MDFAQHERNGVLVRLAAVMAEDVVEGGRMLDCREVIGLEERNLRAEPTLIPAQIDGGGATKRNPPKAIAKKCHFAICYPSTADGERPRRERNSMTALVLVFCLQSAPDSCTEQRPFQNIPLSACLKRGEQYALGWLADHPKWALSRWRCEIGVPPERPT